MKNFSIFMVACAIACGNFAEARLSQEQVKFLNINVIGRDFNNPQQRGDPNYRDPINAYDGNTWLRQYNQYKDKYSHDDQLAIPAGRTLAQEVIRSYVNMKYTSGNTNSYSHRQIGNVLAYESKGGKVIVLKNGRFAFPDNNDNLVPDSIIESHDSVTTLSVNIIKGIVFALKHKCVDMNVHIKNLTSNNLKDRDAAIAYFVKKYEENIATADEEYNAMLSSYVGKQWNRSFGNDIGKYIHTEAQVAVLYAICEFSEKQKYNKATESIVELLPKGKVYSLYDACQSCREINWVKSMPDNFMCHVYDGQACIGNRNNAILKNFTNQRICNIFVENVRASGVPQNTQMYVNGNTLNQVNGQLQIQLPAGHNLPDLGDGQLTIVY